MKQARRFNAGSTFDNHESRRDDWNILFLRPSILQNEPCLHRKQHGFGVGAPAKGAPESHAPDHGLSSDDRSGAALRPLAIPLCAGRSRKAMRRTQRHGERPSSSFPVTKLASCIAFAARACTSGPPNANSSICLASCLKNGVRTELVSPGKTRGLDSFKH